MLIGLIIFVLVVVIVIQIIGIVVDDVDDMAETNIPSLLIILALGVGAFVLVRWRPLFPRSQPDEPKTDDRVIVDRDPLEVRKVIPKNQGYDLLFDEEWSSECSGRVIKNEVQLIHNDRVIDSATIEINLAETYAESARKIYDDLVGEALAAEM